MLNLLTRLFGSRNDRIVRGYETTVRKAAAFETRAAGLERRSPQRQDRRIPQASGRRRGAQRSRARRLSPWFARPRSRTLKMRHFDVQLIGGLTLNEGRIAEMRTGEGKTLMSTLAAYLNALTGDGVHVVTVNEYLAQRDADWMGPIYRFLGPHRRRHQEPAGPGREARRLSLRHHLRHQQRIRLRLPARQPRVQPRRQRAARTRVRHRRRSGLHPHRRSAHAADHLRPRRGKRRAVPQDQQAGAAAQEAGSDAKKAARATTQSTKSRTRRT